MFLKLLFQQTSHLVAFSTISYRKLFFMSIFSCLGGLPSELSQLRKLEVLVVNKNYIRSLPADLFRNMSHLKTLSLASNQLKVFPEGLDSLQHLDVVDLSLNKIETLPDSIGDLQAVELNLNRNQVASLPATLSKCQRLKVLRLEENCLPLEALTPQLLKESQISLLSVDGNLFDEKELREANGYEEVKITLLSQRC